MFAMHIMMVSLFAGVCVFACFLKLHCIACHYNSYLVVQKCKVYKMVREVCAYLSCYNSVWSWFIFYKGSLLSPRFKMSKCWSEIVIGPFVALLCLWCLCKCKAVDSREYATPGLMNKMRSPCRMKVQQAGSKFSTNLSATNWLSLWSLPEGPVIRAFNFPLF